MASKHALVLLACSLALLFVADASILRTTVAKIKEENPSQGCTRIRVNLTPCMKWVVQNRGSWDDEVEDEMTNPSMSGKYKQQCCDMMSRMGDKECMCSGLKSTFRDRCMSHGQSYQGHGGMCSQRIPEKLMNVPKMCGFTNEKCSFRMLLV